MEPMFPHCAGLDVHKKTVVACVLVTGADGKLQAVKRQFGTTLAGLEQLAAWLLSYGVTHVVHGEHGRVLEAGLQRAGAAMRGVGGQRPTRQAGAGAQDRLERCRVVGPADVLRLAGAQLHSRRRAARVARSDALSHAIDGGAGGGGQPAGEDVGGRQHQDDVGADRHPRGVGAGDAGGADQRGERPRGDGRVGAGRLRAKLPQLEEALAGRMRDHHRFMLRELLTHLDHIGTAIATVNERIAELTAPYEAIIQRLCAVTGIKRHTAEVILAEVGPDITPFPTAKHLASWACLCPGNNLSAGKRRSGKTRRGQPWLRAALVEAAWAASHSLDTYLAAQFQRLRARRGDKRAAVAVAHSILTIVWHLLANPEAVFTELGGDYFLKKESGARTTPSCPEARSPGVHRHADPSRGGRRRLSCHPPGKVAVASPRPAGRVLDSCSLKTVSTTASVDQFFRAVHVLHVAALRSGEVHEEGWVARRTAKATEASQKLQVADHSQRTQAHNAPSPNCPLIQELAVF